MQSGYEPHKQLKHFLQWFDIVREIERQITTLKALNVMPEATDMVNTHHKYTGEHFVDFAAFLPKEHNTDESHRKLLQQI